MGNAGILRQYIQCHVIMRLQLQETISLRVIQMHETELKTRLIDPDRKYGRERFEVSRLSI
jgi:hypothetical protein